MKGFISDYYYWTNHNEERLAIPPMVSNNSYYGSSGVRKGFNGYEQEKSMKNKANRLSQDGRNVHSGGSISTREHAKRMSRLRVRCNDINSFVFYNATFFQRMDMEKEPTCFELYERLHRPKGKSNEWKCTKNELRERQSQSGEGSSQHSTQQSDNIYLEIVGGINKEGHIFGLGSQAVVVKDSSTSHSISNDGSSSREIVAMKTKIDALTIELQQKTLEQEMIKQKKWTNGSKGLRGLCYKTICLHRHLNLQDRKIKAMRLW
ncbi:putative transposase, Ptta/En/Spm, plant [Sesbania bispinosa]|nr:putative transposase, Ptta/En/Spm, plant [Sesbania bispinosa]